MAAAIRILYVDDEPELLDIGKLFLEENRGFTVDCAVSAKEALARIAAGHYDAIVSDYQMPGMDGITLLKKVRAKNKTLPFILFTGRGREEVVIEALNEGADFYLQKGGEPQSQFTELAHKIRHAVKQGRAEEALVNSVEELREASSRYEVLIAASNTGAWEYHAASGYLWCSPEYFSMLGRDIGDFDLSGTRNIEQTWIDLLHPEDRKRAGRHFDTYLSNPEGMYEQHFRMLHKDGHWLWIWSRGKAVRDTKGMPTGITVGTHIDVTDRKQAEEALKESEEKFRSLAESSRDYIMRYDRQCRHIYMNPAALRVSGLTEDKIIGKTHRESGFDESLSRFWEEKITGAFETGKPYQTQFSWESAEGHVVLDWMLIPEFAGDGSVRSVLGAARDITQLKKSEEELLNKHEELTASYEQISASEEELRQNYEKLTRQELALRESEEKYRHLIEHSNDAIVVAQDGMLKLVNHRAVELTGYSEQELLSMPFPAFIHPDDRAMVVERYQKRMKGEELPSRYSFRLSSKDGRIRWVEISATAIDWDGRPATLNFLTDITERKQAEEALKESDTRLNAIIQGSPIPKFVIDRDHRTIYWNKALEKYSGIKAEEITGTNQHWRAFYTKERPCMADLIVDGARDKIPLWYEGKWVKSKLIDDAFSATDFFPHMGKNGTWLFFTAAPIRDPKGNIIGAVETLEDVTDVHNKETELKDAYQKIQDAFKQAKQSEELYRNVVETQTEFICRFRPDGTHIFVNEAYCRYFKKNCGELIGKKFRPEIPPEDQAVLKEHFASLNKDHPVSTIDHRIIMPDGTIRWQRWVDRAIFNEEGALVEYQTVGRDITERKRAEERIRWLAGFPELNPNPVIEMDAQGTITFANAATLKTLRDLGLPENPALFIPDDKQEILRLMRETDEPQVYREITLNNKIFAENISLNRELHVVRIYTRNITYEKRAEMELRESEEKFRMVIEFAPVGFYLTDPAGNCLLVNREWCRMAGLTPDEAKGRGWITGLHPDDREKIRASWDRMVESGGEWGLEYRFQPKGSEPVMVYGVATAIKNITGAVTGYIGANIDITGRKQAEKALRESEEKFRSLAESSPDYIMRYDRQCRHTYMNPAALRVSGLTEEQIIGKTHRESGFDESLSRFWEEKITGVFESGKPYQTQFAWESAEGPVVIDRVLTPEFSGNGTVRSVLGVARDITQLKKSEEELLNKHEELTASYEQISAAEEELRQNYDELTRQELALRESEEKYRTVFENTGTATVVVEESNIISLASAEFAKLSGFSKEDIEGKKSWTEFVVKEDLERMLAQHKLRRQNKEKALTRYEFRFVTKSGDIRNIYLTIDIIPGTKKSVASLMDITGRMRAEAALKESEQKYRDIFEKSVLGLFRTAPDGRLIDANDALARMYGYSGAAELLATGLDIGRDIYANPEDRHEVIRILAENRIVENYETRHLKRDGTRFWVSITARIIRETEGNVLLYEGTIIDITGRKVAEEGLKTSQIQLTEAMDLAHLVNWEFDVATGIFTFDDRFYALYGTTAELEGGNQMPADVYARKFVHPDDQYVVADEENKAIQATDPGYVSQVEHRIIRRDGEIRHIVVRFGITKDKNGRTIKIHGANQDITGRKRAEAALTESFTIFKTVMDSLDALVYVADRETCEILFINQYGRKIFGDITGKICWESLQLNQKGPCPFCTNEKLLDMDGNPAGILIWEFKNTINGHWYECHDSAIHWTDGRIVRIEIASDITERKRAEEALRESEEKYRLIAENTTDSIWMFNMDLNLKYMSPSVKKIRGFTVEEAMHQSLEQMMTKKSCESVMQRFHEEMVLDATGTADPGRTVSFQTEEYCKDGSTILMENSTVLLRDTDGRPTGILGISRDITERKKAEEALRAANRNLNLLSGITRHDITNQLTVLIGFLNILKKKQPDPSLNEYFQKIAGAAERIAAMIQFTKTYENIGVKAPAWKDARTLVDTAAKDVVLSHVRLENDLPAGAEVYADPLIARVFYNLMDNAVRYGGKITTIRFSAEERDDDRIIVCEDDGDGIPADEKEKIFERGFGKNTGLGLALAREILSITGITIRETGEPGKGARFEMTVPKGAWRMTGNGA